ncbi:MAG: response regulator [Methylobacteriaceae bacterium]|nr:response regulator [Methylobacteriaceae bacterium]
MASKTPPLEGCRVFVIEDEYFIAADLERTLKSCGAKVVGPIASVGEALAQVRADGFDVVVLDINLRDQMAYPIAEELTRQGLPFVFATGYSEEVIPVRFAGVTRWEKPYDERAIVEEVRRLCAKTPRPGGQPAEAAS